MNNSKRGPQRGAGGPFVMHLERVCRLLDMGARFVIEFNPCSDIEFRGLLREVKLRINDGGNVSMILDNGATVLAFGLTLANYKWVWRCWQNGTPSEAQRRATRWG